MSEKALIVAIFVGYLLVNWFKGPILELQASDELHLAFKRFHDKYARDPRETIATRIHRDFMMEIERTFRRNGICHHLEYTSNSEKAVFVRKISSDDDSEFDVMLVIDEYEYDLQVLHDDTRPGYAWLKINRYEQPSPDLEKLLTYWNLFGDFFIIGDLYIDPNKTIDIFLNNLHNFFRYIFVGDLYVDPGKTIDIFFSELQKLINGSAQMKGKVKLSRHDSAIRMDVYPDSGFIFWGPRLYSVDLVPAYQVGGDLYVSKPSKEEVPNRMTWRRYFSVHDKQDLSGGAKSVLRVLEAVRNREPGLVPLTSYHFKTALLYEMDEERDWSDRALVLRFLGVLGKLEISLDNGNFPHYFVPEINLLFPISPSRMRRVRDRIQLIRSSENELMKMFKS